MIVFLLLFIVLCLWRIRYVKEGFYDDFLSIDKTNAIKGIFIVVVFISHIKEYYVKTGSDLSHWYDSAFFLPAKAFGQLMVVMFLFYSGYGVYESIKKKGDDYVRNIPRKRILNTLVNFDIAVVIFAFTGLLIGSEVDLRFFLSLIAWEAVDNSNWYIFCILACYMFTYISCQRKRGGYLLILLVAYVVLMSFYKGTWWYNTIFAYGAGVMFAKHKDFLTEKFRRYYIKCIILVGFGGLMMLSCYLQFYSHFKTDMELAGAIVFNIMSVFFAFTVVLITMKLSLCNPVLVWLGVHLFPIYIYQRLSMMVLSALYPQTLVASHPYIFLVLCMVMTGIIAYGYRFIDIKIK